MRRAVLACVLGGLSACAAPEAPLPPGHVAPLAAFEALTTSESGCDLGALTVSYLDDDGPSRGRLRVAVEGAGSAGSVEVEVQGREPVVTRLTEGAREVMSPARLQDARHVDQDIAVNVRVSLDCGAHIENVFVFEDPMQRCDAPERFAIAGREAAFYECAEKWASGGAGCGEAGYLLGYGARYARKFSFETRPRMSGRGKQWLDDVLVCLQQELREAIHVDTSCDEVRRIAFDQHPDCYADSGFCTLSVLDVLQVPATIDGKDLFSRDGLRQIAGIVPACGRKYQLALAGFFSGRR